MEGIFSGLPPKKTMSSELVKYDIFTHEEEDSLDELKIKCLAAATSLTQGYIWHNEGFNLAVGKSDGIPCLTGETDFGDFIEDEWLIVWLLHEITTIYKNTIARVSDADGELLLIEAAERLPKWLTIDTSKNRVFIHHGGIHIVTQPEDPGEIGKLPIGQPTLHTALNSIHFHPKLTHAHEDIQGCIRKRISGFPDNLESYVQNVNVFIPEMIARVLDREPNLISAASRAFYFRDPIDLRSCRVFKEFTSNSRVWTQIPMNRCSYAQLMQQIFKPDKHSGYIIPKDAGPDFLGMDLGVKIAHGFEILVSSCGSSFSETTFDENAFQKYLAALEVRDYFSGEIEGSKRYKELLSKAKVYFSKFSRESIESDSQSISKSAGMTIMEIKRDILSGSGDEMSKLLIKQSRSELPDEDNDEWMYLDDNKIDNLLSGMKEGFEKLGKVKLDNSHGEDANLNDFTDKMKDFMNSLSDFEGIESLNNESRVNFYEYEFKKALKQICDDPVQKGSLSDAFLSSDEDSVGDSDEEIDASTDGNLVNAMKQMDAELASTHLGKSFIKDSRTNVTGDSDALKPVDIDLNLVQNFLQSCESETALPGAATTLLHSIGLNLGNT